MNTTHSSNRFRGFITTAILSALAPGLVAVCTAADKSDTQSVVVKYGDLNLSSPQGANTLYRRIVSAARDVCGLQDIDVFDRASQRSAQACTHKAIADAVTKVSEPKLTAIYNAKNWQPLPITVASAQTH